MTDKNWDNHVADAEEIARGEGFRALRDQIVALGHPGPADVVVDVGAGTGLLTLALAPMVAEVWAIDISPAMTQYLTTKTQSAGLDNVVPAVASATSLPLVDASADLVVSNYCFHHLPDEGKRRAIAEVHRVLKPGGRLVFGDMMFTVGLSDPRDRAVIAAKVSSMLRRGPAGVLRLARNAGRFATRRWEQPAPAGWWEQALADGGFSGVVVEVLEHEGGVASARRR